MDPDDIDTLVSLLGRANPGAGNTPDLVNMYGGGGAQAGQSADPLGSDIVPNPKKQNPQALGLFANIPSSMLGQSPLGMLGQTPNGGMLASNPNQW